MNKIKKTIALLLVALMILPSGSFSFGQETDISDHWAKEEINYLIEKGIVNGYPDGTFRPERNITRAEFYKLVTN